MARLRRQLEDRMRKDKDFLFAVEELYNQLKGE